ncbi:MAG: transglutaminase domain-containing protein [Acidobacteriota bacterium]
MSRNLYRFCAAFFLFLWCFTAISDAQESNLRATEWQNYQLPATEFKRIVTPEKNLVFRVPANWQQQGQALAFSTADQVQLQVVIETIPEGISLKQYLLSLVQGLRNIPGGTDALSVRRVQLSGVEAREIAFDYQDLKGTALRKQIWLTVDGAKAVNFIFTAPVASLPEHLPYFKAVVQSATLPIHQFFYSEYDNARSKVIKHSNPSKVNELQTLVSALDGHNLDARSKAITDLSQMYAASSEVAMDLLIDRRPFIRAYAVKALAMSGNDSLKDLLFYAAGDIDWYVAAQAAQAVAALPNALALLQNDATGLRVHEQKFLNIALLLDVKNRAQLAESLFNAGKPSAKPAFNYSMNVNGLPKPPPPPPPIKNTRIKRPAKALPKSLGVVQVKAMDYVANQPQFLALNLLEEVPSQLVKIPFQEIFSQNNSTLTNLAMEMAIARNEALPVELLFNALNDEKTGLFAAIALGHSASLADVERIESYLQKISATKPETKTAMQKPTENPESVNREKVFLNELRVTIKRIQLRERLKAIADKTARLALLNESSGDAHFADWVWVEHLRNELEGARNLTASAKLTSPASAKTAIISPLGENLFPANTMLYTALPKPGEAFDKLGDSLTNLQMDSAREQSQFVVFMEALRAQLTATLAGDEGETFFEQVGINADAPIAFGNWTAEGALRGLPGAQRSAAIVRIKDRDRFERSLMIYQRNIGNFASLANYASGFSHFIGLIPSFFPIVAADAFNPKPPKPTESIPSRYFITGRDKCAGFPVNVITRRTFDVKNGMIENDNLYLTYLGDTALLTPDWYSLRDALRRLESQSASIASNQTFKRAVANGGEVIYTADVTGFLDSVSRAAVLSNETPTAATAGENQTNEISEFGGLKISNSAWENSYRLSFKDSEWTKPLIGFQTAQLVAPRELLPASTFAYFSLKFDAVQGWREWSNGLFGATTSKDIAAIWTIDFEKEVLPELGDEFGVALLELPTNLAVDEFSWGIYAKLKSDKLAKLFNEGKLFKDAGGRYARVKFGTTEMVVTVKNGFLVFAPGDAALNKLEMKEKLADTRDFSKATKQAPGTVVAFGGYNLEAAINTINKKTDDPDLLRMVSFFTTIARAFHSQNIYMTLEPDGLNAQMSVSLAREGRYSVAELAEKTKDFRLAYAELEARGIPLINQQQLETVKLRIKTPNKNATEHIKEIIASTSQTAEKQSDDTLIVTMRPRRVTSPAKVQLPIADTKFAEFLKPTRELRSDDKNVIAKAREIAGEDRDAWSVACKLSNWVHQNLKWRRVDVADAAQTLATLEADCLEFSELYIAMARALGLPARMVTGLAHSGGSFGGHAWVEVYAGEWIELDPTWGTHYVDATHIREKDGELLSYAALNLMQVEILEATRAVPEFQRDATLLVQAIGQDFLLQSNEALAVAFDAEMLAETHWGAGVWATLSEPERERFTTAVSRLSEITSDEFTAADLLDDSLQVLKLKSEGDNAEALVMQSESDALLLFKMTRKNGAWFVTEIQNPDVDLAMVSNTLQPTIQMMVAERQRKAYQNSHLSAKTRALLALQRDEKIALEIAEQALKREPQNRAFRLIKAQALLRAANRVKLLQVGNQKATQKEIEESIQQQKIAETLLEDLCNEKAPPVSAFLVLANLCAEEEKEKATKLYERYAELVPEDPRPHKRLASLFRGQQNFDKALFEYKAVIERDSKNPIAYVDLAEFLALLKRYDEAMQLLDEGAKYDVEQTDLFAELFLRFYESDDQSEIAEGLAGLHPERLAKSYDANIYLAYMRLQENHAAQALPVLKRAIEIDARKIDAHVTLAAVYRQLKNWNATIAATDEAIKIDAENAEAYYHRACALARLGRKTDALSFLKHAIELDEDYLYDLSEEVDLKPLATMLEFKKLLKQAESNDK